MSYENVFLEDSRSQKIALDYELMMWSYKFPKTTTQQVIADNSGKLLDNQCIIL